MHYNMLMVYSSPFRMTVQYTFEKQERFHQKIAV